MIFVKSYNTEFEVEILDNTHLKMRMKEPITVSGVNRWCIPLHFAQVYKSVIDQLNEQGYISDDKHHFKVNPFKDYDAFDLALALYHWLQHNWSGQSDPLYADFCRLTNHYKPSRLEENFERLESPENSDARQVYDTLILSNYSDALDLVLKCEHSDDLISQVNNSF